MPHSIPGLPSQGGALVFESFLNFGEANLEGGDGNNFEKRTMGPNRVDGEG